MERSYNDILFETADGVCTITINRPRRLNAFTGDTIEELEHAVLSTYEDGSAGVVVLTGAGDRAFSAGGDVEWESAGGLEDIECTLGRHIVERPKPVIARVPGDAVGGGNRLACVCDFTIAAEHARLGQAGPKVGSPACGYAVSQSANIIGHKRAREMWMLTRQYTARQMLAWGLVNAVVPMDKLAEEVERWCGELLALSPTCLKLLKESFRIHMEPILKDKRVDIVERVAPGFHQTGAQQEGPRPFWKGGRRISLPGADVPAGPDFLPGGDERSARGVARQSQSAPRCNAHPRSRGTRAPRAVVARQSERKREASA